MCGDQFEGIFMAVRSEHLTPVRRKAPTARKKGQTIKKLRRMIAAGQDYYEPAGSRDSADKLRTDHALQCDRV